MRVAKCRKRRGTDFARPFIRNNPYLSIAIRTAPPSPRSGACMCVSGARTRSWRAGRPRAVGHVGQVGRVGLVRQATFAIDANAKQYR